MNRKRLISATILLFSALIITLMASRSNVETASAFRLDASRNSSQAAAVSDETFANCRYGAAPADNDLGEKTAVVSEIGAGWYLTFNYKAPSPPPDNGADFVHMIHVKQKKDGFVYLPGYNVSPNLTGGFADYIRSNPGDIWIVGNEVDRGPNPGETNPEIRGQGDTFPKEYAIAYHEIYNFIKRADPTAQVAISGLVEVTPGRLQYLDKVWSTYLQEFGKKMPVDVWTMHLYILPEVQADGITPNGIANVALDTDPAIGKRESGGDPAICNKPGVYCFAEHDKLSVFQEQAVAMRQWMANHGEKEKPLLLTEYSILYPYVDDGSSCWVQDEFGQCFTEDRVYDFMTQTFNYLNNSAVDASLGYSLDNDRLIQQYMWYSVYTDNVGDASNLVKDDLVTLTTLGQNFQDHVESEPATQNLLVEHTDDIDALITDGTATAELAVTFRNNGNSEIDQPFTVTFYEDSSLTFPIGSVEINQAVFGCANRPYVAAVKWSGLTEGNHKYWVKIDSGNVINEGPDENDNVGSGKVRDVQSGLFLPVIQGDK